MIGNYGAEAYRVVIDGYTLAHLTQKVKADETLFCEDACVLCERAKRAVLLAEHHDLEPEPRSAA
jgi:hypothetical protein